MESFDSRLDRTHNLLQYLSPQDTMQTLVDSGVSPEDAYLLIQAAQTVPSPPQQGHSWGGGEGRHKMSCIYVK